MDEPAARVDRDLITGQWRVICDLHGELARYGKYWTAARDVLAHRETCELYENGDPPGRVGGGIARASRWGAGGSPRPARL